MTKFCRNCGAQLKPDVKFCRSCGTKTQGETETGWAADSSILDYTASRMNDTAPKMDYTVLEMNNTTPKIKRRGTRRKKLIISATAVVLIIALGVIFLPGLIDSLSGNMAVHIDSVGGQPYANRAVTITGDGFGDYNSENSRAVIDGMDTPIIGWGEHEITLLVPEPVSAGKKEILLVNPPFFKKKTVSHEFQEHTKTELTKITLSPEKETIIEGEGFVFIAPEGSVMQSQEIIIYKYEIPTMDDNPYYTVSEEYEITGPDGGHVFFEQPVYFGVDAADGEEAAHSAFQIFDEITGVWASAETWYSQEEARVYLVTTHFSGFRRFVSDMRTGFGRLAQKTVDEANKKIEYVSEKLGMAEDKVVELSQDLWINVKDATTEEFVGVSDANKWFIVYYRVSDAANDPSLNDKACLMAASFSNAYEKYRNLFGTDKVPSVTKKVLVSGRPGDNPVVEDAPAPINVYIDPRVNKIGAQAKSATTGNIIMPSEYSEDDMASTCAHELFHAVQYSQLGMKMLYMSTTGLKSLVDNRHTGNDTEVYRFFANNAWFLEATAEYAGRFVGTSTGLGAPIHQRIEANRAYYTSNGTQEYGISSFLEYILSIRQPDINDSGEAFKEMWNYVTGNYSMASDINTEFDKYVRDKLNESADMAFLNFWREAFTRSYMPEVAGISGGLLDTGAIPRRKISGSMDIKENGAGIFRYSLTPAYMWKDETALTRSFWLEAAPASMCGDVYLLDGIEMSDRMSEDSHKGIINPADGSRKDVLIPYAAGDIRGLVAVFQNTVDGDASIKVTLSSTTLKWDNQKDIEKKVSNTTLRSSDKLKFTPTLPEQKKGDLPFTAVVTLNDNLDYQTEIDLVENGKSFEVGAPMKELPPDKILVNIKIYKDGELVHEYQSADSKANAKVEISGPEAVSYELDESIQKIEHAFSAKASPAGDYNFEWSLGDSSPAQKTEGGSDSDISHSYTDAGEYTAKVTLYDKNGKALSSDSVRIVLEKKGSTSTQSPAAGGMDVAGTYYYWYSTDYLYSPDDYIDYESSVTVEETGRDAIVVAFQNGKSYSLTFKKTDLWDEAYTTEGEPFANFHTYGGYRVIELIGSMGNNSMNFLRVPKEQSKEKEYAWVLVDTVNEDRKELLEATNKSHEGIYEQSASAAPGSYTHTWKYVGESDDYPDPDQIHGESFATQLTISVPPAMIKAGETVSLSFNLSFTDDNLSYFAGTGSCRADWDNLRFKNTEGKVTFEIYSSVKYKEKNVSSVSDTISAVIPAGYSEGEQVKLWTGGYAGTYYIYEWQQIK